MLTNLRKPEYPCSAPDGMHASSAANGVTANITVQLGSEHIGGILFQPALSGPWPLIICSHGLTGTHENLIETCVRLTELGVCALAFDFRNSNGPLSSGGISAMSVETEVTDLTQVLSFCQALPVVIPDKIVLLGHSQGGLVSALVAGRHPASVAGLILMYPAFSVVDDVHRIFASRESLPPSYEFLGATLGRVFAEDIWDLDVYREIAAYDKPVLIMHGTEDTIVPAAYSERAARTYAQATFLPLRGAGHGFRGDAFEQSMDAVAAYLRQIHILPQ